MVYASTRLAGVLGEGKAICEVNLEKNVGDKLCMICNGKEFAHN